MLLLKQPAHMLLQVNTCQLHPSKTLRSIRVYVVARKGKRQALGRFPRRSNLPQRRVDHVFASNMHDNCTKLYPPFNPIPAVL